jgi:hypothetical protein
VGDRQITPSEVFIAALASALTEHAPASTGQNVHPVLHQVKTHGVTLHVWAALEEWAEQRLRHDYQSNTLAYFRWCLAMSLLSGRPLGVAHEVLSACRAYEGPVPQFSREYGVDVVASDREEAASDRGAAEKWLEKVESGAYRGARQRRVRGWVRALVLYLMAKQGGRLDPQEEEVAALGAAFLKALGDGEAAGRKHRVGAFGNEVVRITRSPVYDEWLARGEPELLEPTDTEWRALWGEYEDAWLRLSGRRHAQERYGAVLIGLLGIPLFEKLGWSISLAGGASAAGMGAATDAPRSLLERAVEPFSVALTNLTVSIKAVIVAALAVIGILATECNNPPKNSGFSYILPQFTMLPVGDGCPTPGMCSVGKDSNSTADIYCAPPSEVDRPTSIISAFGECRTPGGLAEIGVSADDAVRIPVERRSTLVATSCLCSSDQRSVECQYQNKGETAVLLLGTGGFDPGWVLAKEGEALELFTSGTLQPVKSTLNGDGVQVALLREQQPVEASDLAAHVVMPGEHVPLSHRVVDEVALPGVLVSPDGEVVDLVRAPTLGEVCEGPEH